MRKLEKILQELQQNSFHGINEKDEDGNTTLHFAAVFSSAKIVKLLIEKGADVNIKNNKGETPLHKASYRGKRKSVKEIIKAGADVNARDNNKSAPLHHAARSGSRGNIKGKIKELINAGAEINAQNNEQRTPLHEGVQDIESIKTLIQVGSDVNLADENGHTALHYACMGSDERVVEMLIQAGANVDAINEYGMKPISYAEMEKKREIIAKLNNQERKELSEIGKDYKNINPRDVYKEKLKEIENKAYKGINEKNKDGETILYLAVRYGSTEKVKELIERGADINIGDNRGKKVLHYAAVLKKIKKVKILIEKGANVNATCNNKETPLHLACLAGAIDVVKVLIKAGADINAVNILGESPLYYVKRKVKIENLLRKKGGKFIDNQVSDKINNMGKRALDVLERLTLTKLKGKVVSLNEIKKRDKSLIRKDSLEICKEAIDIGKIIKKNLDKGEDV